MHSEARFVQKFLISIAAVVACTTTPAFGSACTNASNPCTNSSSTGQDSTDRTTFNTANSDLLFSNITFNDALGTYGSATSGLNSTTNTTAVLDGVSFIGCISTSNADCASNSGGLVVQTLTNSAGSWDGGTDGALRNSSSGFQDQITAILPNGVFAIAFDILMANNTGTLLPFGVVINNGSPQMTATAVNLPGSVFFGYRSATAIQSVTIFDQSTFELLGIDNFELGQAPEASEATTLIMVGSGLFMLQWMRRRFS